MKKKYYTNNNETISIYRYMELCGLVCSKRKRTRLSHEAMLRKVLKRYEIFPENIFIPHPLSFDQIQTEDILLGKIVYVVDDYKKVIPYSNPLYFDIKELMTYLTHNASEKELRNQRNVTLKAQGMIEDDYGELMNLDEYKYCELYECTEKHNRDNSFISRGGRSLKRKKDNY